MIGHLNYVGLSTEREARAAGEVGAAPGRPPPSAQASPLAYGRTPPPAPRPPPGPSYYASASNGQVAVKGKLQPYVKFQNGVEAHINLTVLDGLKKPLLAVSTLASRGFHVYFGPKPYVWREPTDKYFHLYERGGVYALPAWISTGWFYPNERQGHASA